MSKNLKKACVLGSLLLIVSGCQRDKENNNQTYEQVDVYAENEAPPIEKESGNTRKTSEKISEKIAYCVIGPRDNSSVIGAVTFTQVEGGVRIVADVAGLSPGKHGFHIHEHGDCSAHDGSSAGGHFNPTNKKHGGPDSAERHVGDLGNLIANEHGFAHYDRVDTVISLTGPQSIIGKSIIVHADADDLQTDPTGNAGKRIGCGAITEAIP